MSFMGKIFSESKYIFIVTLLCVLNYAPVLNNGFMVDDTDFLTAKNQGHFTGFNKYFSASASNHFSPLYYFVNIYLFNHFNSLPALHSVNIILFISNGVAAFYFLRMLGIETGLCFLTALLFVVHPFNAFAVQFITANFIFLNSIFIFFGLMAYLHSENQQGIKKQYFIILSFLACALGFMSFEGGLLFAGYLFCTLFFIKRYPLRQAIN